MNVTLTDTALKMAHDNSTFKWVTSAIKYLGVWLDPRLLFIFERNFSPLLKNVEQDLRAWHSGQFSWFGRAAICKMVVLPRVLYLIRALPVKIPLSFFKSLHPIEMKFIWAHKPPRIRSTLLTRSKERGGMGIPDFKAYYFASHVARIIDWHCHSASKDWISIESYLVPAPLQCSPWMSKTTYPKAMCAHPLVGTTLGIFHQLTKYPKFSTPLSPVTPLSNNPGFPPGLEN